ncbi:MAG: hypothetical protein ABI624_05910, partial [Casimicrobiaceae bacterium]
VTGFHGARRYVNRHRDQHRYFTLYDVAHLGVFKNPEYVDLVDQPTPWSASMRPDFSNFVRAPCDVVTSAGDGIGAALAIVCYEHASAGEAMSTLAAARELPGVTACHLGEGQGGAPPMPWSSPLAASPPLRMFDRVALIETLDRQSAVHALAHVQATFGLGGQPPDFGCDVYDLAFVFPGHDASERGRHRRPHWDGGNAS